MRRHLLRIDYLADHPELVPELALLHFGQWGYLRPAQTLEERTHRLRDACGRGGVPSVVVALDEGGALCGSAMLVASDMDTRPELTPWLAGVYVVERFRGRGYGSALVARVESEAAAEGVDLLYLYTPSAAGFYARLGWTADERCEYLGQEVTVMSRMIGASADDVEPA
jgi:GNAT superfamily N-acetyltransferase